MTANILRGEHHEFREGLVANETQYFADRLTLHPRVRILLRRIGEITP